MTYQVLNLLEVIEETRKELIQLGSNQPLVDPKVVKLSQKLDNLLNEYQKLISN